MKHLFGVWLVWLGHRPKVWWAVVGGCILIGVILIARGSRDLLSLLIGISALIVAIYMVIFEAKTSPPQ